MSGAYDAAMAALPPEQAEEVRRCLREAQDALDKLWRLFPERASLAQGAKVLQVLMREGRGGEDPCSNPPCSMSREACLARMSGCCGSCSHVGREAERAQRLAAPPNGETEGACESGFVSAVIDGRLIPADAWVRCLACKGLRRP